MVTLHVSGYAWNGNPQVPPLAKQDLSPAEVPGEQNDAIDLSMSIVIQYDKRVEQLLLC